MEITNLKVTPESLTLKADEITAERTNVSTAIAEIDSQIAELKSYWQSTASDEFQTRYATTKDDVDTILLTIQEYVNDLTEIAALYKTAEESASNEVASLPSEGVF